MAGSPSSCARRASLLAAQGANPFRISAYRRAADAIETLDADVRSVAEARRCLPMPEQVPAGLGGAILLRARPGDNSPWSGKGRIALIHIKAAAAQMRLSYACPRMFPTQRRGR